MSTNESKSETEDMRVVQDERERVSNRDREKIEIETIDTGIRQVLAISNLIRTSEKRRE